VTGGTTSGPTITSSAGTNATIPTASGTASGAVTTGAQTWAGTKTFNNVISGSINGNAATATLANNINRIGTTTGTNLNYRVVLGAANSNSAGISPTFVVTDAPRLFYNPSTDSLTAGTFNASSTVGGGFQGISNDTVSTPSFTWTGDLTTGIYIFGAGEIGISGSGNLRARFGGNILFQKNTFILPVNDQVATNIAAERTISSATLNWRGKYWNGISSVNTTWNTIYVPTDTLGNGEWRLRNGTNNRLIVDNSSTLSGVSTIQTSSVTSTGRLTIRSGGILDLEALPGTSVRSLSIYNNESAATTDLVRVNTAGALQRSTSSIKYKKDVETLEDQYADALIDNARPVWYRSKCQNDNPDWGYYGFIAEELVQIDPRLVGLSLNENGSFKAKDGNTYEPESVGYISMVPILFNLVKRQKTTIQNLETTLQEALAKIETIEQRLSDAGI
jgi:hypothetical protein